MFPLTRIVVYPFFWRARRKRRTILGLHNLFSQTEKILISKSWSHALANWRFHFLSWKGWNFAFLQRFSGYYFSFLIVFCRFPFVIVQILSFEQNDKWKIIMYWLIAQLYLYKFGIFIILKSFAYSIIYFESYICIYIFLSSINLFFSCMTVCYRWVLWKLRPSQTKT